MKIKEQPLSFRPREKLEKSGAENLSREELVAVVISSGMKGKNAVELSREILNKFGDKLHLVSVEDLCKIKGLGKVKALKLKAMFEFGLRSAEAINGKVIISSSKDAFLALHDYIHKKQEHLLLITLNGRNQLISKKVITIGTLDASLFHPREIFAESIIDRASKILVAHNHPSGNLEPSRNDLIMTQKIKEAGDLIGIQLVDSLIISEEGYKSIITLKVAP